MKQRKLAIESKDLVVGEKTQALLHPTDLRSAFEIARTVAIIQGVECKVIEETPIRHTLMKVDADGNVQTIRGTILNIAKKQNIPCQFGKTWKTVE